MSAYRAAVGWVVQQLMSDEELRPFIGDRVYEGLAPLKASYPLVTVQSYTDPTDVNFDAGRALTRVDLIVRVWVCGSASEGSSAAVSDPVAGRVDELLTLGTPVSVPSGSIRSCRRYSEVHSVEWRDTVLVRADGGKYLVTVCE